MAKNNRVPIRPITDIRNSTQGLSDYFTQFNYGLALTLKIREAENLPQMRERRRKYQAQKEQDEKEREWLENYRKQDRERQRRNAEISKRERNRRLLEYSRQQELDDLESKQDKEAASIQYERDFYQWYNRNFGKIDLNESDFAFRVATYGLAEMIFDGKNASGSLVTSSIDTNGKTIFGKITQNNLRKLAANAYDTLLLYQERLALLDSEIQQMENAPLGQQIDFGEYNKKYNERNLLLSQINSKDLTDLVDAYKLFYVLDRKGWLSKFISGVGDAIDEWATYDKYVPALRNQKHQDLIQLYDDLVNQRIAFNKNAAGLIQNIANISGTQLQDGQFAQERLSAERKMLQETIQKADADNDELRGEYENNRTHLAESTEYWNVAKGYKMGTMAHANDFVLSPRYLFYNLPPMIGSSASSPSQAVGSIIKGVTTLGGIAAAPFSEGASLNLLWVGELASTPLDWLGAKDENYAEIGEKRLDNIVNILQDPTVTKDVEDQEKSTYDVVIDELKSRSKKVWKAAGWTDSQINEYLYGENGDKNAISDYVVGLTQNSSINTNPNDRNDETNKLSFGEFMHPAFQDALLFSTKGLEAQFDANMMRTAGELPFLKAMALIPVKWLKTGGRALDNLTTKAGQKFAQRIEKSISGRISAKADDVAEDAVTSGAKQASRTKYTNGFDRPQRTIRLAISHGYLTGAAAGDVVGFGFAGHVAGGIIGGAIEGGAHLGRQLINAVSPRLGALIDGLEEGIAMKYQGFIDKLTPNKAWQQVLLKYGIKSTKRNIAIGMSEAAEEAVQYLNSKDDFAGKYGWAGMSLGDWITNDLRQGGRVLDAYLSLVGLGDSPLLDDEEFWQNAKGGFILGGLPMANPSGIVQTVGSYIRGVKEYQSHQAVLQSGVMNREYDNINRASTAEFVRQAVLNNEQHVMSAIDQMEQADRRRENPYFTQEDYNLRRKDAQIVMSLAKNSDIRQMLEAKGILYGTEKYAIAVADLYTMQQLLQEGREQISANNSQLGLIYNSQVFQAVLKGITDDIINNSVADKEDIDREIKKLGDSAVVQELEAIRGEYGLELGSKKYNRTINKPENRQRISDARERAELMARESIRQNVTDQVLAKTRLVNRLQGLLTLKAKMNTIDDFYTFLKDKFNLSSMRPDANTIRKNIDQLIIEAKQQLALITKGTSNQFNENLNDALTLNYLESALAVVHTRDLDLQQLEATDAMLKAANAVTQSYYDMFNYGLVKNSDGKWQYNPAEFKSRKAKAKRIKALLEAGDIEGLKRLSESAEQQVLQNEKEVRKDDYLLRVDAIMEANKRNQALKWAINEVANGDAINKLMETLEERRKNKQKQSAKADQKNSTEDNRDPFDVHTEEKVLPLQLVLQQESPIENKSDKIKNKYQRRKQKVRDFFDRQRAKYNRFSKGSLKSGIPFLDLIVKGAYMLAENAALGVLKFSQFVELIKEMLPDASISEILPSIKAGYNKRRAYFQLNSPDALENMSSSEEVMSYTLNDGSVVETDPDPIVNPFYKRMQDRFDSDANKIIDEISSHFDIFVQEEDGVHIYKNVESILHSNYKSTDHGVKTITEILKNANTSDAAFKAAIESIARLPEGFPVDTYVKYRNVDGVEEAIARNYLTFIPNQYVLGGILVRDAAIAILLGKDALIDLSQYPGNFLQFKDDILQLKKNLTDLGLVILNTKQHVYGINSVGDRVCALADIVAADENGKIYVIDVRSGYKTIRGRWDSAISSRISYTIHEQAALQLKIIESIINDKFKASVKGLYVLPVIYDKYSPVGISAEKSEDNKMLIPIKTETEGDTNSSIEQLKNDAENLIEEINLRIDDYNQFVQEAHKYTQQYNLAEHIVESIHTTVQDYVTYIENLRHQLDEFQSRIDNIKQDIQNNIDRENTIWIENALTNTENQPSPDVYAHIARLEECCRDLDIVMLYVPRVKATTLVEKDNIKALYQSVFDAQKALDGVLQHPEASNIDVTNEAELIASVMDTLAENKDNFGAMSVFVRRWWADNFVIGNSTNTQQSVENVQEQSSWFVNTINTWINTLTNHVLNELDHHEALLEWYSSILNNYFAKLLDNALTFGERQSPAFSAAMNKLVTKGKLLISDFNTAWGTNPGEDFQGPPANEAERINRMPVKWKDLYDITTSHCPAFDAMANSIIYYVMSTSPTFVSGYKTQSSPADNFDDKSTRFTLFKNKSGEVELRINWWDGRQWKYVELPFNIDISKYPHASENQVQRFVTVNRANKKFTKKVSRMLDYIEKHPEYKLEFTVTTNKGSINYGNVGEHHNVLEFLFKGNRNEHDLYTIKLSQKDRVGVGVFITDQASGKIFYDVRSGDNLKARIGGFDESYAKQHLNTQNGAIVYFYDNGDGDYIGIPLQSQQIGINAANQIVDLILKYVTGDGMYNGYDIMSLLKQRLYMYDPSRSLTGYNNRNNLVTINQNGDIVIGNQSFNIFNNKQGLINRIAAMSNSTSAEQMNQNLASSNDQVMQSLSQRFASDPNLDKIALPNGFTILREDFTHHNTDGTVGSTWLGYLLRNNILGTRATSRGYKQVNIDNLKLVDKNSPIQLPEQAPVELRKEVRRRRTSSLDSIEDPFASAKGGLTMTNENEDVDINRGSEEQEDFVNAVREYFKTVFGTDADVLFEDAVNKYITPASKNQRIIGITTSEMVKLSRYAPYSTMYHEAFHKLLELVLPSKTREEFYNIYKSKNGKNLTERQVAEGLADLFVDYMSKRILPKDAKWYNKIFKWFKSAGYALNMCWNYGISNTRKMYTVYQNMNAGKYAGMQISKEAADRFKLQFGDELYYNVNGVEFLHIADSGQLQLIVRALGYYILESYGIDQIDPNVNFVIDEFTPNILQNELLDDLTAEGVPNNELTAVDLAFKEILKKGDRIAIVAEKGKNKGKVVGYKYSYPNFKAIRLNVSDYIQTILGEYSGKILDEQEEYSEDDAENRNVLNMNIDRYDRASYEFSKLDSQNRRVKLFFATIPYCTFDEDGKIVLDYSKNEFNCPTFTPLEEVYNVIVNDLHTVRNINELDSQLRKLAEYSPMHRYVYSKYHRLISSIYTQDDNGNTVIDYDKEAFAIQILNAIRSQKIDFVIARSKNLGADKGREVEISSSSLERDSRQFPKQWTQFLTAGQVSVFSRNRDANGNFIFREGMGGENNTDIFSRTAAFINDLRQALSQSDDEFSIDGELYHKDSLENVSKIKSDIISKLHQIGIIFSREALDHMLLTEYGDMGSNGLLSWLTLSGPTSINTFIDALNNFVKQDGTVNKELVEKGYRDLGFVRNLAKWQGAYNRIHTQQMALGLNGKRLFSISQNSSISHIINALNTEDLDNETISTLMGFNYNITGTDFLQGSRILKAIRLRKGLYITAHTYIGFKSDNKGDSGQEYTEEATVDDYIAKLTMLQLGYMIFPTLADKGTWMILSGVDIPGMTFQKTKTAQGIDTLSVNNAPRIKFINGNAYIIPSDATLNLMLEYANTERLAICQCMEDLGYENIPGYQKLGRKLLSDAEKIVNYHTPNKDKKTKKKIEPNGTRFLSLTKIVCKEVKDGETVINTYNLNDPNISSTDLLKLANEKFFSKSLEEQKEIMALTLGLLAMNEIDTALLLGLIERKDISASWTNAQGNKVNAKVDSNDRSIMNLLSKYLNEALIQAVTTEILKTIPHKDYGTWLAIPLNTGDQVNEKNFKYQIARSMAIASILADATYRSIICSQEVQRCFSGHPAQFKVDYDLSRGEIKDSAYDIQKRIGGMISTGDDNVLGLPGIPSTYTCAEYNDYEVSSSSDIASKLDEMFLVSEVREVFSNNMISYFYRNPDKFKTWTDKIGENGRDIERIIYKYAYDNDIDKLYEVAVDEVKTMLDKAKSDAKKFSGSYKGGINVADGAAYITDTMCENMLRMRGAYNGDVKKAFDILRSDDTKYSWTNKLDAYKIIYEATNIVTTKYTAYGFRNHSLNGEDVQSSSNVAVAYYNKFALFPLFPCIATGSMHRVYQKMLDEGVDMLLMQSAVKVGSQGSIDFNPALLDVPFNKYTQSYAYLRRQLNTDPEEGDKIPMGTQMVKIGLQNLRLGRTNYRNARTGEMMDGQQLLDSFMNSIKALATSGMYLLKDMFFEDGTDEIDPEKLSKYLKSQLSTRNANKAVIEAINVTTDPNTGKKKLVCPLAATPDASWIESILISTINKKIIDIVTPGSSFVQRSVFAIESSPGEGSIQSDANMAPTINGGNKLLMINNDGSMDAVISIDYFDDVIFKGKLKNMSFDQKRQWLFDHGIIGNTATANTIGYRIPTQAQSSIHALRFVDVIPAVKSTIILPEEFTKITGSDFDIDHLYLASYNYNIGVSEDGVQYATTVFNPIEDDGKNSDKYHQNNIIDCLMTLLKDSENSINSLYKSIDNDTELIKNPADQVKEEGSTKSDPYNFGTLHEQVIRKNDYITGKTGIGPFALNVTNQILTRLYGVSFRRTKFTAETGISRLDHVVDVDGNSIASWLSAFINAHVDIVKDPYISRLNVNPFTYNMCNLLIRSGFGEASVWFLAQPIIRDMANASQQARSQYSRDPQKAKSTYAAQEYAIMHVVGKYLTEAEYSPAVINRYTNSSDGRDIAVRINTVNWIMKHKDVLAQIVKNPNATEVTVNGVKYNVANTQKIVFYAWKTLEKYSIALGDLVLHTKIDTRKHGNSLIAIRQYLDAYNKLFHYKDPDESIWDMNSLHRLITDSWIELKTNLAINMPTMILGKQTFAANQEFINAVIRIGNALSTTKGSLNKDTLLFISRSLITAIKSKYIIKYAKEKLGKTDADIAALFVGPRSINRRLVMLKNAIETNPKYTRLKNNHLINQIYSEIESDNIFVRGKNVQRPAFITVLDNVDDSRVNSDLLTDGWYDLLQDEDVFVRLFARDLIIYSFLTSGEFKGWHKLFKYVPSLWIMGEIDTDFLSFSDYISNELTGSSIDYDNLIDDIVANNFTDYRFAKRVPQKNEDDDTDNFVDITSIVKIGRPVDENQLNSVEVYITSKDGAYSRNSVEGYSLYKLQGFIQSKNGYHPIYVRIKKKGYHGESGHDIYEYGWNFNYAENENEAFDQFDLAAALDRVSAALNNIPEGYGLEETSARAITDVYLGRIDNVVSVSEQPQVQDLDFNAYKTESFGVEVSNGSEDFWNKINNGWQELNVSGIVAYRKYGTDPKTFTRETVEEGWIGNPFDWRKYGPEKAVQMFYDWLTTGNTFNEPFANEEFRLAVLWKIMRSGDQITTPILYYKELGYMSHTTVIGYLINNKFLIYKLLSQNTFANVQNENINGLFDINSAEFYSGGARGSDSEWAAEARRFGIKIREYTPTDFNSLSKEWKNRLDQEYKAVVEELGRRELPIDSFKGKLVRRDMMQADKADAVFAIVSSFDGGNVPGGTAYAVTRAWQRGVPVYVFDQSTETWYNYDTQDEIDTPYLTQHAALIGTRDLKESGKKAIKEIFDKTLKSGRGEADFNDQNEFPTDEMNHCKH